MTTSSADSESSASNTSGPPGARPLSPSGPKRVQILGDTVVNQIAAGEVVERPSSVVKELVENAIDAGAREITVVLEGGGRSVIEVIDDGCGMDREDALLAVERFGTSKVRGVEDLQRIATHGFRGEALPSIASVSRFTLETMRNSAAAQLGTGPRYSGEHAVHSVNGVVISIDGGTLKDVGERGMTPGTKVTVRNLFFNVPARRKFLRSESTEEGMVRALLLDVALAYPELRIKLRCDGREVLHFLPRKTLFDRAKELEIGGRSPICFERKKLWGDGELVLTGAVSEPLEGVSSSGRLRLLVNRRSVRDRLLLRAVRDAYGNFLRPGRHPHGVVAIDLPPSEVDVNVHPQKTEVRFHRGDALFAAVLSVIRDGFAGRGAERIGVNELHAAHAGTMPAASDAAANARPLPFKGAYSVTARYAEYHQPFGKVRPQEAAEPGVEFFGTGSLSTQSNTTPGVSSAPASEIAPTPDEPQALRELQSGFGFTAHEPFASMRYVGQLFRCYLVLEGQGRIALVDMHAAHERVMFFKIKSALREGKVPSQLLLLPERMKLPPDRIGVAETALDALTSLGFEAERFADDSIVVRAIPALLGKVSTQALFLDLFALPEWGSWSATVEDHWDAVIARLACHRSVRSGRELEEAEVYQLLRSLVEAEGSGYCPHGRPVVTYLRETDLEQMFGR